MELSTCLNVINTLTSTIYMVKKYEMKNFELWDSIQSILWVQKNKKYAWI